MKPTSFVILLLLSLSFCLSGQRDTAARFSINEGTMIGVGRATIQNSYLSPGSDIVYHGWGIQYLNEQMKMVAHSNTPLSYQRTIHLSFSKTKNRAETVSAYSGFIDYSFGYHYHYQASTKLRLLFGATVNGFGGFVLNTQRGNNPSAFHFDLGVNASSLALYSTHIKKLPLVLRYQMDLSFMGLLFSPRYGQSYYELFNVDNRAGMVHFSSLHNKVAMRNYLTCDLPLGSFIIRAGYINQLYTTNVKKIKADYLSHGLMIGLVKEFVSFKGRQFGKKELYNSAYY